MNNRKGSSNGLLGDFYRTLEPEERWAMKPGQFYWSHVVYPRDWPTIVKVVNYDPLDESKCEYQMKRYSEGDEKHYPLKDMDLRQSEMWYVYTGKKRLVIVVGYTESKWFGENKVQKVLMCAPLFEFQRRHTQEFVIETQAFVHPNLFYLPDNPRGCYEESAVRFEMIQPIMKGYLQPLVSRLENNRPVILSDMAYWLLITHLVKYICGKVIDDKLHGEIEAYRELLLESFSTT